jgi:uncharacterized repeat protein (TIGR04138 family)
MHFQHTSVECEVSEAPEGTDASPSAESRVTGTSEQHFCEQCAKDLGLYQQASKQYAAQLLMEGSVPSEAIESIVAKDPRYRPEAYKLTMRAVGYAYSYALSQQSVSGTTTAEAHVAAKEILESLRSLALMEFETGAKRRLNELGVKSCEDVGEIVFNLIDAKLLGKQSSDRKEDFQNGYNFDEAFNDPKLIGAIQKMKARYPWREGH